MPRKAGSYTGWYGRDGIADMKKAPAGASIIQGLVEPIGIEPTTF